MKSVNKHKVGGSIFLILIIVFYSCGNRESVQNEVNIIGDWAFIDSEMKYAEAYVSSESITFFSDADGQVGPFRYLVKKDSIFYDGVSFMYKLNTCNNLLFISETQDTINLIKMDLSKTIVDSFYLNPYHLRRCNFLVKEGIISMEQAYNYVTSIKNVMPFDNPK